MRKPVKVKGGEDEIARARLLAHFEDHPEAVFYSRQLEVLFENEHFHWVTNRALNRLVHEGRILSETRQLSIGSPIKLMWHKKFRFYKRTAAEVFELVDRYSKGASEGALGLQGETMILKAFARQRYLLEAEEARSYNGKVWKESDHNLDFIFEKDGIAYGIEVKNTLGYIPFAEFKLKIDMCQYIGVKPVFAVRALPRTWAIALIKSGGYAMIMRYQFYPWTERALAREINERLGLPVDAPRRIADGTMHRFENWRTGAGELVDPQQGAKALKKIQAALDRGAARRAEFEQPELEPKGDQEWD